MAAAVLAFVPTAFAQITNSAHDFSVYSWSGGEICKPCHTPHFANRSVSPLWNHTLTNATYLISGGTQSAARDMDAVSRLCLSCHDGTVALDSFGGASGSTYMPGSDTIGKDLRDDHPIGNQALYPPRPTPVWWSAEFRDASGLPPEIRLQAWLNPSSSRPSQPDMVVGCTTCHNAHNRGYPHLLNMANAASALCMTCHIK